MCISTITRGLRRCPASSTGAWSTEGSGSPSTPGVETNYKVIIIVIIIITLVVIIVIVWCVGKRSFTVYKEISYSVRKSSTTSYNMFKIKQTCGKW